MRAQTEIEDASTFCEAWSGAGEMYVNFFIFFLPRLSSTTVVL